MATTDPKSHQDAQEAQRGRGRNQLPPTTSLQIPKNRSTGNLAVVNEHPEASRVRFSMDASSAVEYDSVARTSFMTDHDHGLGASGLRRIRQHPLQRAPTLPSTASSSRRASTTITRSTSMSLINSTDALTSMPSGPASPNFAEDLTRFPSESLHSFSFAHQSEDFVNNRQNVLKRSIEFMKDRMGWLVSSNAAIASAQARVNGDIETQDMLDLLARAQLVGAGNLPQGDTSSFVPGPLTGPAEVSGDNVFERQFAPRTSSPEPYSDLMISPTTTMRAQSSGRSPIRETIQESSEDDAIRGDQLSKDGLNLDDSEKTPTDESSTRAISPPAIPRPNMRRTFTDVGSASREQKLMDVMARPFMTGQSAGYPDVLLSPTLAPQSANSAFSVAGALGPAVHGHSSRWAPAAQAIFTTEAQPPWTILAANDLACLVFGVTKAEVRKLGILEVVQEERRAWLEQRLLQTDSEFQPAAPSPAPTGTGSSLLGGRGGITAHLLSKPNSRSQPPKTPTRRSQTVHSASPVPPKPRARSKSRGVLLCGDVVPIQKRNGATGSASLWVKEKRTGLIWVLEEIHEHSAYLSLDEDGLVTKVTGETGPIWGDESIGTGMDVGKLITRIPRQGIDPRYGAVDYAQITKRRYFTCRYGKKMNIPATVTQTRGEPQLHVSSFPHIAGIVVVNPDDLKIKSTNSAFSGALFGHEKPESLSIHTLLPDFTKVLGVLTRHDGVELQDGIVIPEHSFRKAWALLALQEGRPDAASVFLNPDGLPAKHRDGSELKVDVQMRVVKSEKSTDQPGGDNTSSSSQEDTIVESELVYALWITYSRHLHTPKVMTSMASPLMSGVSTPLHQPSPGQMSADAPTPLEVGSDSEDAKADTRASVASALTQQLKGVAKNAAAKVTSSPKSSSKPGQPEANEKTESSATKPASKETDPPKKKTIDDFVIIEEMGQGAYGQVKLARYKNSAGKKVVLKYVTKRRILVDTWTRDRRLGTVPLEIHVLDYLRRDGLKHPNIMEMDDFFEDETNYYIEMAPHGLPGMDLFDYIELRTNMQEDECRSIFVQVAKAVQHLHIKAKVVHRDIKDENVILDGEGNIKLIDFGSAAYIKSGPFDVFVGTIDYAAPEVLAGKPYGGKEQDVWALGILLYTIIYKENPFYSIDEIMDRDLRIPYIISEESIDLVRGMLDRDVSKRFDINQVIAHPWCQAND